MDQMEPSMIDLDRVRAETPGVANVAHLNNAGAALMPQPVLDALLGHLQLEAEIGGYEAAARNLEAVEHTYDAVARLINCDREEIALVENATRAWDMAFYSLPLGPGDRILTAMAEYASNYIAFLEVARKTGAEVVPVPDDEHGQLDVAALKALVDERTKLIAVTHVPTNGGLVNPAAAIGRVAREAGVPYLLDACQSVGQLPVDVREIGCSMLSATSRKYLRGPRGAGFLYVQRDWISRLEPVLLDLRAAKWVEPDRYEVRSDARRFETWETNVAGQLALGVAVDYALDLGIDAIQERVYSLAGELRDGLAAIPGVTVADQGVERCGIVTFHSDGVTASELQSRLSEAGVNTSVSVPSGTLLDSRARALPDLVRASVHYYNSEAELERLLKVVAEIR
jgi:cysteine desulfurase / selenocysteine lyase